MQSRFGFGASMAVALLIAAATQAQSPSLSQRQGAAPGPSNFPPVPPPQLVPSRPLPSMTVPQPAVMEIPSLVEPYRISAPAEVQPVQYLPPVESLPPASAPRQNSNSYPPPASFPSVPNLPDVNPRMVQIPVRDTFTLPPASPVAPAPSPTTFPAPPPLSPWSAPVQTPPLPTPQQCTPQTCPPQSPFQGRIGELPPEYQYRWQLLPRMFGDKGNNRAGTLNFATDVTNTHPDDTVDLRSANSNVGGQNFGELATSVELSDPTRMRSIGATAGVQTATGTSTAVSPTIYGKQLFMVDERGYLGGGLGLSVPIGRRELSGGLTPWLFYGRETGGGTFVRGLTGFSLPFSNASTFGIFFDHGILVPLQPVTLNGNDSRLQSFLAAELHASYALRQGNGNGPVGFGGNDLIFDRFGRSDFNFNATLGAIFRKRKVDLYFGVGMPILSDRTYDYEVISRVGYRF